MTTIPTINVYITEPLPPPVIEALEGTKWLAEHDAAIREGIAAAIEADMDMPVLPARSVARRGAFIARHWVPDDDGANPYRDSQPEPPELFPGTHAVLDDLTIRAALDTAEDGAS